MTRETARPDASEKSIAPFTVAAVNMAVVHDKPWNLRKINVYIAQAAAGGARLIVFPEQALQGCVWSLSHEITAEEWRSYREAAETIPGPSTELVALRAAENDVVVVFGMTERRLVRGREVLHNACPVISPGGLVGVFRKVHLVGDEVHLFWPGNSWPVFDTPVGKLGILICYDNQFPESARSLVLGGAQILVMPTAWPMTGDGGPNDAGGELYDSLTRLRAQENQTWLVAADQVGPGDCGSMSSYGHSRIVAPTGSVIAETDFEEGLALATIDLAAGLRDGMLRTLPLGLDYLKDRRPDTYGRICESSTNTDES